MEIVRALTHRAESPIRFLAALAALVAGLPGCSTAATEERRAYVLARPHAWVELTIADAQIPDLPKSSDSEAPWERPESCSVSVALDGEPWMSGRLFPQGERAPYSANSGFRFPVPVGQSDLRISYGGCRVAGREPISVQVQTRVVAEEALVYELVFDGTRLDPLPVRPDSVVSLEDVYEAVTGRRAPAE